MLNKNNIIQKNELQIKVYNELIAIAEDIKILLSEKEGKQANKRINDYLRESLKTKYPDVYISIKKHDYFDRIECELYHQNRSINTQNNTIYIEDNNLYFIIADENKKIDMNLINDAINQQIKYKKEYIKKLEYTIKNIDNIKKEYEEIKGMIESYKAKYDYSILNDLYVNKF